MDRHLAAGLGLSYYAVRSIDARQGHMTGSHFADGTSVNATELSSVVMRALADADMFTLRKHNVEHDEF